MLANLGDGQSYLSLFAQFQRLQISMSSYRKSQVNTVPLLQGSQYSNTNQLYKPLRQTLQHPQIVRQHSTLTPVIAQGSLVSKDYRRLNSYELQNIERNIYVPDGELVPTNNLDLVRGEKFVAVDACEKIAGPPISAQQMEKIRRRGVKTSHVVYQVREPEAYVEVPGAYVEAKVESKPSPPPQERYNSGSYDNYGKHPEEYKYNLFSCIDQPANECKQLGCGKCTGCPSNQVIASENHPASFIRTSRT